MKRRIRVLWGVVVITCVVMLASPKVFFDLMSSCSRIYYSDERLYCIANECIIKVAGLERFNAEVRRALGSCYDKKTDLPMSYNPPSGSCLHDVCRQLPSAFGWELVEYGRLRAIGARYGDHYAKYVWLVAVDPAERISADGDKVRRIADNVVVVFPPYTID